MTRPVFLRLRKHSVSPFNLLHHSANPSTYHSAIRAPRPPYDLSFPISSPKPSIRRRHRIRPVWLAISFRFSEGSRSPFCSRMRMEITRSRTCIPSVETHRVARRASPLTSQLLRHRLARPHLQVNCPGTSLASRSPGSCPDPHSNQCWSSCHWSRFGYGCRNDAHPPWLVLLARAQTTSCS